MKGLYVPVENHSTLSLMNGNGSIIKNLIEKGTYSPPTWLPIKQNTVMKFKKQWLLLKL